MKTNKYSSNSIYYDLDKLLKKWDPIINNIIEPFKLHNDVKKEIAVFIEKKLINDQSNENFGNEIKNILITFKDKLLNKYDANIKIVNSYYNRYLNRIVYELENGDIINSDTDNKNIITNNKYENDIMINLFYSIADPAKFRESKIKKIKNLYVNRK